MVGAPSHPEPSIDLQEPCRLDLHKRVSMVIQIGSDVVSGVRTKADTRVLVTNVLTLLVGKEHISRETTLGRVGIWQAGQLDSVTPPGNEVNVPFFFFSTPRVFLGAAALVFGMAATLVSVLVVLAFGGIVSDAEVVMSCLRKGEVVQTL